MELVFLGTGAGIPSKKRNVSSIALTLQQELNSIWLFDCGEATQHQILHTTIKPRKINKIFITHMHGDHIFGLPGLLGSRSFQGGTSPLTIYGPPGIKQYVETNLTLSQTHVTYPLSIVEITEGKLFEEDMFTVYCQKLVHGVPSYGFKIVEKDKTGELLVEKLKEKGIMPGPIYQQIKDNDVVITPDGQELHRKDYVGPSKPGRIICILGDTRQPELSKAFVENANVLVHEATFSHDHQALAHEYFHSTTTQAATLAKEAHVKKLILTHISARYQHEDIPKLLHEAQAIFKRTSIASDLGSFKVMV